MKKIISVLLLILSIASPNAIAQSVCGKDMFGNPVCSPPGGWIGKNAFGTIICAPGNCVADKFNNPKCSGQQGGAAAYDVFREPICSGGCIDASESYCNKLSR